MGRIGGGGGGGVVWGVSEFLGPPSKHLLSHSYKILNTSSGSSAQIQSIGTLFGLIGLRGGLWTSPQVRGTRARVQAAG
jgi:hypothetical protein